MGISMGLGIGFGLSWVEVRTSSLQASWSQILKRAGLSSFMALLIFTLGAILQGHYEWLNYGSAALSWIAFSTALGYILSLDSSIDPQKGVSGGLIAGVISFVVFVLASVIFENDTAKLLSFLALGGILGYTIVYVVQRAEAFELECISPKEGKRTFPITRFLKEDRTILIGSDRNQKVCKVVIKWPDEMVAHHHVRLTYQNEQVFIEALAQTLVDGRIVRPNKQYLLKHNQVIRLGRDGRTRFRYIEKMKPEETEAPAVLTEKEMV